MNLTPEELGFPPSQPPGPAELPPGDGRYSIPYFTQFAGVVSTAARTYLRVFDEALRQCPQNAEAMRRDPVIFKSLRLRQYPTAQLGFHIEPDDETNPEEIEAATQIEKIIERIPRRQDLMRLLLEAIWYGRYGVQIRYEWTKRRAVNGLNSTRWLTPVDFTPIHGDSIYYKWSGQIGILVNPGYMSGNLQPTDLGMARFLNPLERQQFIFHRHEPEAAEFTAGEMAGRVHGVGLRDRLYWVWWLKYNTYAMLTNYLERFSNGLTIFYYEGGNDKAKQEAFEAAKQQFTTHALLYPRYPGVGSLNGVERLEVGTATPSLLERLVTGYYDGIIEQTILGQNLTYETAPTGLGSGVAEAHGRTFDQIIKYDAQNLEATEQADLVAVLYRWNYPKLTPGRIVYEIDTPNATEVLEHAQMLYQMGLAVDADSLYNVTKLAKPKQDSQTVSKVAPMQPAAVDQVPAGVPIAGQPGPDQQQLSPQEQQAVQQDAQQAAAAAQMTPQQFARNVARELKRLHRYGLRRTVFPPQPSTD